MCADVAPIVLRLRKGKQFAPGAFHMGRVQPWVNVGALLFILFSTVRTSHLGLPRRSCWAPARQSRLQPLLHTGMPGASWPVVSSDALMLHVTSAESDNLPSNGTVRV